MHQFDREEFRFFAGLYPHQINGVSLLTGKGRAILGDDMGLGKTRQAIVAMEQAAPALLVEARATRASGGDVAGRIQAIGAGVTRVDPTPGARR